MRVVDGKAKFLPITGDDFLKAGKVSLGVLGVTLEYTMEVQEMSLSRVQNIFDRKFEVSYASFITITI